MISYCVTLLINAPVTCDVRTYRGGEGPQRVRDLRRRLGEPLTGGRALNEGSRRFHSYREDPYS